MMTVLPRVFSRAEIHVVFHHVSVGVSSISPHSKLPLHLMSVSALWDCDTHQGTHDARAPASFLCKGV